MSLTHHFHPLYASFPNHNGWYVTEIITLTSVKSGYIAHAEGLAGVQSLYPKEYGDCQEQIDSNKP
jgi:hypothetical protein